MNDTITISQAAADGLNELNLGDFYTTNTPERMAYIVLILRRLPDQANWFPKGKWATIQHIEDQLDMLAEAVAIEIKR